MWPVGQTATIWPQPHSVVYLYEIMPFENPHRLIVGDRGDAGFLKAVSQKKIPANRAVAVYMGCLPRDYW